MALQDLGIFASIPDEEEEENQVAPVPTPAPTPTPEATSAPAPSGGSDLGMFADIPDEEQADPFAGESPLAGAGRAAQNFVRGVIDPITSVPAALELAARVGQKATDAPREEKIEDTLGFKTTKFLQGLADFIGTPDARDQSLGQQVASGAGSVIGIGGPAVVASIFGTPAAGVATGAGLGSAQMAVQMFEEAREKGADEDTALLYGGVGGVIGLSDILPIGHALKLLPPAIRTEITGTFLKKAVEIAGAAGEEAAQEYGQQVAQNLAANGILGEDRQWDQGALEGAIVGAIVGSGVGAVGAAIPDKKPKGGVEVTTGLATDEKAALTEQPVTTQVTESAADKAKRVSKERARRILEERRASQVDPEIEVAIAATKPEPTPDPVEQATPPAAAELAPPAAPSAEAATSDAAEAAAAEPVPGADTALDESIPMPQGTMPPPPPLQQAPEETIPTVPESPETLALQVEALKAGKKMAVLYPFNTPVPPEVGGGRFKRAYIPNVGVIDYDSRRISNADIRALAKFGKLNEVLELGPTSKADAAASIQSGSPEVAVTERTPEGVEVKAAVGTEATAPEQVAALEESVTSPGNTVQVETPAEVIEQRQEPVLDEAIVPTPTKADVIKQTSRRRTEAKAKPAKPIEEPAKAPEEKPKPRYIRDTSPEAMEILNQQDEENAYIRERARAVQKESKGSAGKNWQAEQRADREKNNDTALKTVAEFAPIGKTEDAYLGRNTDAINSRAVIKARAAAMVEAAEKAGVKIPERVKDAQDESMNHNEAILILMEARALARKESPGRDDFDRFVTRERLSRGGERTQVVSERRSEGNQKKATGGAKGTDNISGTVTAEVTGEPDEVVSAAALDPGTGDEDVQTKAGKSARMGVRGLNSEGAASGEKLDAATKAKLIAEMNRQLEARRLNKGDTKLNRAEREKRLMVLLEQRSIEVGGDLDAAVQRILDGEPIEQFFTDKQNTVGNLAERLQQYVSRLDTEVQRAFFPIMMKKLGQAAPDTVVMSIPDEVVELVAPGADGYYSPDHDMIVVKESLDDEAGFPRFAHVVQHETAHAVFYHSLRRNNTLRDQLDDLRDMAQMQAGNLHRDQYGFTDVDEFLSEAFSNPDFQSLLARTTVSTSWWKSSGLPMPANPVLRNIMNWLKGKLAQLLGVEKADGKTSVFNVLMDVGGALMETAPAARDAYYMDIGISDELAQIQRIESEPAPKSVKDKLAAAGLSAEDADAVAELISEEFDGEVSDEDLAAIAAEFSKPVTSQSDLDGKASSVPPGGKAAVEEAASDDGSGKPTKVRAFFLKTMTLDFMRQKYGHLFVRDGKRHLDEFIKGLQRRDAIVKRVADVHDKDAAAFIDYSRKDPAMAAQMADLAMDATRFDVNLGPNADNSHLGINSKRGLQAKKQLADLQARFDALAPEAKKLFTQMTDNYRKSHNAAKTKLAENVLDTMDLKLSPADRATLVDKVVNGTLTEADKDLVGSPTIWRALKNASGLRAIKGAYFPQMRFGDHVVVTTEKIDKPTLDHIMVKGKSVPVQTEVAGNVVRFTADNSIHGVGAELDRQVSDYVASHPLRSLRVSRRWKDRKTGEIVEKGDQKLGHDYDLTYEVELQTKGVHYFESNREARKFAKESQSDQTSPVLERRSDSAANAVLEGTDLSAIVKRIDSRTDMTAGQRAQMKKALEEAVVASMPGNRSPARYQARRNVLGASKDIGRAAATYGAAQGNFMAMLETAPQMREDMKALGEIERQVYTESAGAVSQVMNELRRRIEGIDNPDKPNELAQTIAMVSFFDKLASPAASVVNATQVAMNTGPVLGGRYGNVKASAALVSAYHRIGAISTIARGIGGAAKSIAQWQKSAIDTSNIIGSIRKKLGPQYDDLLNELISRGALDENAGFEIAAAVMEKKGIVKKNLARFDRAVRQLPNAVEMVNRSVTAVATYDLAKKAGKSDAKAIEEAFDTVMNTQGDYRAVNTPRFMKQGLLSFAMQFRKYALLQTQLYADMYGRIMKGATGKEKAIAAKQLMNLMTMQVLVGGAMGLPGLELIKIGITLAGMLGLTDDEWEEWERKTQDLLAEVTGPGWANLISNGVITRAIGIDVSSRMSQADLWTGFAPESLDVDGITQYAGGLFLGAPGQTVLDWTVGAPQKFKEGDVLGALELLTPVKTLADTVKAVRKYDGDEYDLKDAILQSFGFKSAAQADASAEKSREYDEKGDWLAEADKLRKAYAAAKTNGEKAKIKGLIRDYNKRKKPEGVHGIDLDRLTKAKKE